MSRTLLSVDGVTVSFPGLIALNDVSLQVASGEIVAVIGHNGSGKSTLVKVLAGIYRQDRGTVTLHHEGPDRADLHFIHQDLGLIPALTSVENLTLARRTGVSSLAPSRRSIERERTRDLISRFGQLFDVDAKMSTLSPAQRAIVAIARAMDGWTHSRNVLVLDEPTEALHRNEVDILFSAVKRVAADGAGVIFISHRLDEVLELADRVVVLRDGVMVADEPAANLDHSRLVELVTGATLDQQVERVRKEPTGDPVLRIRGMHGAAVHDLHLDIRAGETVGIAGVLGSGREEVPSLVFGSSEATTDEFSVGGEEYTDRTPARSIARGIAFVAGDRARLGAVRELSARENLTLPQMRTLRTKMGHIDVRRERAETERLIAGFQVRPPRTEQKFSQFSGGNQQKIVLAKWLRNKPRVLLLEEPTQGVDIGAKAAIYAAIDDASAAGTAVLVCSSDAKELLRLCDRVLVLRDGRISADLSGADLTEHRLVLEGYGLAHRQAEPLTPQFQGDE